MDPSAITHGPGLPAPHALRRLATGLTPAVPRQAGDVQTASVAVAIVRGLLEASRGLGVDPASLLAAAGLDAEGLRGADGRVPYVDFMHMADRALDLAGDEGLGLRWADTLTERTFAPLSHLLAHCGGLREALELLARYVHVLSDRKAYVLVVEDGALYLRGVPVVGESPRHGRMVMELLLGGLWRFMRGFHLEVVRGPVCFAHARPAHHAAYTEFFGAEVRFGQPHTQIEIDPARLDAPGLLRDDEVRDVMQEVVEKRLRRAHHGVPWAQRVRDVLVQQGGAPRTDMAGAARAVGVSVRTLRRRLQEEGTAYDVVCDEARCLVAKRLLREADTSIQEIAFELGFSDASTFHRAFKRWAGTTPGAFRQRERLRTG